MVDYVLAKKYQTGLSEAFLVKQLAIDRKKFYSWKSAYGLKWDVGKNLPKSHHLEQWEKDAIISFYQNHPQDGYRRCAYMMMDKDIVYAAPSTVYYILKDAGVMRTKSQRISKKGTGFEQPTAPHEHWHSDITMISAGNQTYFLISIIDGFSRFVVAWDLRISMKSKDIGIVFEKAREAYPEAKPRCISDNGTQYKCHEFKKFITRNEYTHVTTSPYYPQSNGKQERFHGSLKSECVRLRPLMGKDDATDTINRYIQYYNTERLHSSIDYVSPKDKIEGKAMRILNERDRKLKERRLERKEKAS